MYETLRNNAVTKLRIEKGVISEAEFKEQLLKERATYQTLLHNDCALSGRRWLI